MLGVVLCGGQSARMGTDKGLLPTQSGTWAQAAVQKFSPININAVLSVNEQQMAGYLAFFDDAQLIKDNKSIDVKGPLLGLLSVHILFPEKDLFVLACDMPLMETGIMELLVQHAASRPAEAHVFANDGVCEPLCGIYTAKGLSRVLQLQKNNQLAKHSMKHVLELLNISVLAFTEDQKKYFSNINTHAALNGL